MRFIFIVPLFSVLVACGNSDTAAPGAGSPSQPCNVSYGCPAGQTCWSPDGKAWQCVTAGSATWGDPCNASGPISCGDRLLCVTIGAPTKGTCTFWCDADNPCQAGTCQTETNPAGGVFHFCAGGGCSDKYDCQTEQTCATVDGITYQCRADGSGKVGDTCSATINSPVTCGDHLTCLAKGNPTAGSCVPWCDIDNPCASGRSCQTVPTTSGPVLHLCL